jgi:hypothetical protein
VKIIDYASGSHTERASYKELIDSVLKRQVDVVLVFHYDRLARSTIELITRVDEFHVSVSIFLLSITLPHGPRSAAKREVRPRRLRIRDELWPTQFPLEFSALAV